MQALVTFSPLCRLLSNLMHTHMNAAPSDEAKVDILALHKHHRFESSGWTAVCARHLNDGTQAVWRGVTFFFCSFCYVGAHGYRRRLLGGSLSVNFTPKRLAD